MKKCAIIFKLVPEADDKNNEELRQEISTNIKQMVIPYCAEIAEVVLWNEA